MTEMSDSWDAGPGEQHTDWTGARRGTQGTTCTGKRMQWENKGFSTVLTTWAFIPERWWKQQNQTRTYMRKQWKQKNWIWDMTGICHCKHQRHNRTTWGTWASQTYLEREAHQKSYSKEMQTLWSGPNWPSGWAALVDLQDKLQLQQHETDRGYTVTPRHSDSEHPANQTERGRGEGGKPEHTSWLRQRILGQPFSTSSSNLGPRTGLGRTQEPCFFCTSRNPALWGSMLHSLTEAKEHFLFFPTFSQKRHCTLRSEHPKAWPSAMTGFVFEVTQRFGDRHVKNTHTQKSKSSFPTQDRKRQRTHAYRKPVIANIHRTVVKAWQLDDGSKSSCPTACQQWRPTKVRVSTTTHRHFCRKGNNKFWPYPGSR